MLQLNQGIASLKQAVRRGIAKLPKSEPSVRGSRHLTSAASWVVLNSVKGTSAQISSDSLPSSSASSIAPSIFSRYNSSTSSVLTIPTPSLPNAATSDDGAEKDGRCSDLDWEHIDMEIFLGKGDERKVCQSSESDTNNYPEAVAKPWSCVDGTVLVQTTYGYSVIAPATGRGSSRTSGMSLKIGMGMDRYDTLAIYVAEYTCRENHEDMVFTSNVYDHLIYDQCSYETWVEWQRGRPAEDRVLWVLA